AGYNDPCSTRNTSSEVNSIALAMAWPCAGPSSSVRRISKSSVPCSNSIRSLSFLVDILGEHTPLPVECQGEYATVRSKSIRCRFDEPYCRIAACPSLGRTPGFAISLFRQTDLPGVEARIGKYCGVTRER